MSESARQAAIRELARRGEVVESVSETEKARRLEELKRCRDDLLHFVRNYVWTYDPRLPDPFIRFVPYPRQVELFEWLIDRERTQTSGVVEKSRDVGATESLCSFFLHHWLFTPGWAGGLGSRKLEYVDRIGDPKSLFERLRMALRKLPYWMMPPGFVWKQHSFECRLINPRWQSTLMGEGGAEIGRGGRTSMYAVDEYNYLEHPDQADAALRDNTNCVILIGSPNGMTGIYEKRGHWPCFTFHWTDDPRKNRWVMGAVSGSGAGAPPSARYPWYEQQKQDYRDKPWIVRQEIDIDYLGSGYPKFDRAFLAKQRELAIAPLMEELVGVAAWAGDVSTWVEPEKGRRYLIVCDVAEGIATEGGDPDWSVAHVYDVETWEQVCHYRGRCDTHALAVDMATLGEMYEWADVCIERTGPGLSTITAMTEEFGYPSVYTEARGETYVAGWLASARTKKKGDDDLASVIADMAQGFPGFVWHHLNTFDELLHYMVKPTGRCEGEKGWHDDEVSCCRMAGALLPTLSVRKVWDPVAPTKPRVFYGTRGR